MQKRQFLSLLVAGATAISVPFSVAVAAPKKRVLNVGMDAAYPPFGVRETETGAFVGYDVDIIRAIGAAEGFDVRILNLPFDGLIPALKAGNIDVAINDITITEERAKSVDFSNRYYIAGLGVVVEKGNTSIRTPEDLEGKRIAVTIGSTGEEAVRGMKNVKIRVFNQLNECFLELKNGGVDAVVNDIPTNDYYANDAGRDHCVSLPIALTAEDLGIAIRKGNPEVVKAMNSGLAKIKQSGEFSKIYQKWFGKEPPAALLKD
ncbi:basic amino acid ABC transporter substrate-binding protein [Sutterella sp.]|uniref:basic amino acid ABC transporter substrate-binding protein n=1 Tax=Sutterella sp. TaxID=1981025 RepID=UPI0026E10D7C|nr:basic amino acid ABC transporter substrate-binding protein [Sutterella sp.]MDO5532085.1 basic amino acid ABC transporter substrate-binding protein [Sutterella sp.]